MYKKYYLLIFVLFLMQVVYSQNSTRFYIGLGESFHSFQDTRFSDVIFSKASLQPELGFTHRNDKSLWLGYAYIYLFQGIHPATGIDPYTNAQFGFRAGYLRNVNEVLSVGGIWDLYDNTTIQHTDLANSDNFYLTSSDVFGAVRYHHALNDHWKLMAGADMGLFSFIKMAPSFTTNFQQNVIDNGELSLEDDDIRDPFNLEYMDFKPIWNQLFLRTNIELFYKRKLSLAYQWRVRSIVEHRGYPVVQAKHSFTLRFHIISRPK